MYMRCVGTYTIIFTAEEYTLKNNILYLIGTGTKIEGDTKTNIAAVTIDLNVPQIAINSLSREVKLHYAQNTCTLSDVPYELIGDLVTELHNIY